MISRCVIVMFLFIFVHYSTARRRGRLRDKVDELSKSTNEKANTIIEMLKSMQEEFSTKIEDALTLCNDKSDASDTIKAPSGVWKGYYKLRGKQYPFEMSLVFNGSKMTGNGTDNIGKYTIAGTWDTKTGVVHFLKQYVGAHSVNYEGTVSEDGCTLSGIWKIGSVSDSFNMSCTK